jgi:hypothetical protein
VATDRKKQVQEQVKRREASIASFSNTLKQFLKGELTRLTRGVEGRDVRAIDAARILGGVRQELANAGLGDVLVEVENLYANELDRLEQSLTKYGRGVEVLTGADVELVEALATFDFEQLANEIDLTVDELRSVAMRKVMGGDDVDLSDDIDGVSDRASRYGETTLRTALAGMNRSMTLSKSEELGLELFVYLGPDDDITRPFCEARVGQVFTRQEIDEWDNGQGLDAAIYCGGYNCRHQLSPISEEDAKREYGYQASEDS